MHDDGCMPRDGSSYCGASQWYMVFSLARHFVYGNYDSFDVIVFGFIAMIVGIVIGMRIGPHNSRMRALELAQSQRTYGHVVSWRPHNDGT